MHRYTGNKLLTIYSALLVSVLVHFPSLFDQQDWLLQVNLMYKESIYHIAFLQCQMAFRRLNKTKLSQQSIIVNEA